MLTAYTTALPSSALPVAEGAIAVVGAPVVLAVLVAALSLLAGAIAQRVLAGRRGRPTLRLLEPAAGGAGSRRAA